MPEPLAGAFSEALALEGLVWIALTAFIAGVVRGFSGFGTAMIFIPVAAKFLEPIWVLIALVIMDILGPIPNLPRAWRDGRPRDVGVMALATLLALPLGIAILVAVPAEVFRYVVSVMAILVPVLLVAGVRYRGEMTRGLLAAVGAVAGVTGGAAGLPGPPVILLYASSTRPVAEIRGNIMIYLVAFDVILLGWLGLQGRLEMTPVALGLLLFAPIVAGNILGAAIFDPARERMYRGVAYAVIFVAALTSLPIWE